MHPGLPRWASCTSKGPYKKRCEDAVLPALKMEEGAMSQGVKAALEARKGKETDFSP